MQDKSPEKELNEMEATKIPDAEIKPMVIRLFKNLMGKMGDVSDNLKKSKY